MILIGALHDVVNEAGAILGALVALVALNAAIKAAYRRTLGRRRDRYARLGRLGTGAQLSFFEAVLGEPPAMRKTIVKDDYAVIVATGDPDAPREPEDVFETYVEQTFQEATFIDRDYYVQMICDEDETVLAFSVTVRRSNFHPVFQLPSNIGWRERRRWKKQTGEEFKPLFKLRLGRTRFADLDRGDTDEFQGHHFKAAIGAHSFFYSEDHYYGRPGNYQTFVFTVSDAAGAPLGISDLAAGIKQVGGEEWPDQSRSDWPDWAQLTGIQSFRRQSPVTTFTVIRVDLRLENFPSGFGPRHDEVRTLP